MKYMLLIYDREEMTPEDEEREMPEWFAYSDMLNEKAAQVYSEALMPSATASTVEGRAGQGHILRDGPFMESKEVLGGFFIVEAADLDTAADYAAAMPHIKRGGKVEIRPVMEFPDSD